MILSTEYQKMLAGELYDAGDEQLLQMRIKVREQLHAYNQTKYDKIKRAGLLKDMLGKMGNNVDIQTPFFCDYGCHIEVGDNFFANFNCVLLDCNYIKMGNNVFLAPGVQIYAAHHPLAALERIKGPELATAVTIGNNVWIGGGAIICPGITIGDNTSIGAGSVVVKDIPAGVLAAGNPCKIIRQL
jgi:maltose O-acetyltransferase